MHLRTLVVALAICGSALPERAGAQAVPGQATVDSMAAFFVGHWGCEGAFSNGRPLSADVTFESALDGRWLSYAHVDRPPGRFAMRAMWGYDAAAGGLVSAAADNGGGLRVFRAPGWRDGSVVFERAPLGDAAPRAERFIYRRESDSTFRMTWEVRRDGGTWVMGDYVACMRK